MRRHPLDEREQADGAGGAAFGFLDARELAINFRERRRGVHGQFLAVAAAQGEQNIVRVDRFQRARGQVGIFRTRHFRDQMRRRQRPQNLLREPAGHGEFGGHFADGRGRQRILKTLAETRHQTQRDKFPAALVHVVRQFVLQIGGAVLEGIRDLRAEQQNQPRQIKSGHEHRQQAEAAVNLAVGDDARNVKEAEHVVQMPECAGRDAADERGGKFHFRVRHQQINQRKREPQNDERDEFKK